MNRTLRNILAVVTGLVIGSIVNMGIIMISGSIVPPPAGLENTTMQGLKESMHLFRHEHFIFPFLAHALGTLAGAFTTTLIAISYKRELSFAIGAFFLLGGLINIVMLPSPLWFSIVDLTFGYIPMAYLGYKFAIRIQS